MKRVLLSIRLLLRDIRSGELNVIIAALLVAIATVVAINSITERLEKVMSRQATELLGADLVLRSAYPAQDSLLAEVKTLPLKHAETVTFPSVVVANNNFQLAAIKAVSEGYPLRGELRVGQQVYGPGQKTQAVPAEGEVWLEPRLFGLLNIKLGETLTIGDANFKVTQVLTYESDRSGDFYTLSPRVLLNLKSLPATKVIQPGSRVAYFYLFSGLPETIEQLKTRLTSKLQPSQRLLDVKANRPALSNALERAERYLRLAGLIALALAGVAIAVGVQRYAQRHYDAVAIMRAVGYTQAAVLQLHMLQLVCLVCGTWLIGSILGLAIHHGVILILGELLPPSLPPVGWQPWGIGLLAGLGVMLGFALPSLLQLKQVPPLRVLRRDLLPPSIRSQLWYGIAVLTLGLLMWWITQDWVLAIVILVAMLGSGLVLSMVLLALIRLLLKRLQREKLPLLLRFASRRLLRHLRFVVGQVLALGLTLMVMALIFLLRTDLLSDWQKQLPVETPNYFAMNIMSDQVPELLQQLTQGNVSRSAVYPIIRGRLQELNQVPIKQAVTKEAQDNNALRRELNFTWSDELPADNKLVAGQWWTKEVSSEEVSIESQLAKKLGIKLGDQLLFNITGQTFTVKVTSIREVNWESFKPNFYFIFPKKVLDEYAATNLLSFYLPPGQEHFIIDLIKQFPSVTLLDIDLVIRQVRQILTQVTLAIECVLGFVLAAALAVLAAAIASSRDERLQEAVILRALGAETARIRRTIITEFALLGALAGTLAVVGLELTTWFLYEQVFNLDFSFHLLYWFVLPISGTCLIGAIGWLTTRQVTTASPMKLLTNSP
ncbi:FtsX-like permease family protein [Zooshikella marina]|uniref:ABC transporter permease n=1 Tax=Zooshikella ganghwensis TaxID=202772 RepID=UPI001BAF9315|nr:FtsX-like permease family protein [Zooshikella ganghwensis]MBU2707350.1 FtsX-like permease family protein [Zooshikella ganghwensis]